MPNTDSPSLEKFIGRYSIGRDSSPLDSTGSLHFLRIKVPGGLVTSNQFRRIATLATEYSRQRIELTNRQDIQLHWIRAEDAPEIFVALDEMGFSTDMCGQSFPEARHGDMRNIVSCPTSGIEKDELVNGYPLAKSLTNYFTGNPDFLDLPRKFKISISGCGSDCTRAWINDLAFVAVKKEDKIGYTLLAGGSAGFSMPGPRLAKPTGLFVRSDDAFDVAVAAVEIHRDHGNRESKSKARFKWLIEDWGIDKFKKMLQEKIGKHLELYAGPLFLNTSQHEKIRSQSQDGLCYLNIPLVGARLTDSQMNLLSDLADKYGSSELRLTPMQNIIIPNVKEKDALLKRLEEAKLSLEGSNIRWNSMACSSDFCGKTCVPHARETLNKIIGHLEKYLKDGVLDNGNVGVYINGCLNSCCASMLAPIGLNGRVVREDDGMKQTYDLFLGGSFGQEASFGRLIEEKIPASQLEYIIESLLKGYLKDGRLSESFVAFCNRYTIEELKAYLNSSRGKHKDVEN